MTDLPLNPEIKAKPPQETLLGYLTEYFTTNPQKLNIIICFYVKNHTPELFASLIKDFRKSGISYEEIGKMFGGIGKGTIHRIESGDYWFKKEAKQEEIIKRLVELI